MPSVLPWYAGGLLLAFAFLAAIFFVKPIGISTQFVIANGIIWDAIDDTIVQDDETRQSGYASSNAYLDKSGGKYASNIADPWNYSFVFVLAVMAGAFLSSRIGGDKPEQERASWMPNVWAERFGEDKRKRLVICFIAGVLVLFGARLAGGCTSGHMMSGMMQTALSGYLFALGAFAAALPIAILLFNKK
ncbi:MAG: YeeE/YedE thiosulfate transporter family protein [Alphaproteobacteria bacterium]